MKTFLQKEKLFIDRQTLRICRLLTVHLEILPVNIVRVIIINFLHNEIQFVHSITKRVHITIKQITQQNTVCTCHNKIRTHNNKVCTQQDAVCKELNTEVCTEHNIVRT